MLGCDLNWMRYRVEQHANDQKGANKTVSETTAWANSAVVPDSSSEYTKDDIKTFDLPFSVEIESDDVLDFQSRSWNITLRTK